MADAFVACAFFMPEVRSGTLPKAGSGTLPEMGSGTSEMGSGTSACGGVRHFARDGVRPLCPRWGQAPLPEMGSGTSSCGGGLTPEGIVTYLHLRFILRCFIIVGAGDSTNIA